MTLQWQVRNGRWYDDVKTGAAFCAKKPKTAVAFKRVWLCHFSSDDAPVGQAGDLGG